MPATKNEFFGGNNSNADKNKIKPNQYLEAHNLELTADGNFFGLRNLKGTTVLHEISSDFVVECLDVVPNKYKIGDDYFNCLTIFTVDSTNFKIWCYDTENDVLYELYEEAIAIDYTADDRVIDAETYPENGIDIVYYTDFYNEIRKVRCEIPTPYVANFLTSFDLSVQRRGGTGSVSFDTITAGSLLSGTYQFAYRMVNPETKTITKWSSLTNPVHVYSENNTGTNVPYSGVGLPTLFGIQIDVNPTTEELTNFPYFQLAVVENIFPTGSESVTSGENTVFVASLQPLELIANRLNYVYKANTRVETIPITDLTVDLAQIQTVKTLSVHQNRLWGANVKYRPLDYDNGDPAISSGTISRRSSTTTDSYADHNFSSQYIGYFRNEVYRFGVVYTDKYGNKSAPKTLDLTSITDNQISGAIDMKFPDRSFAPAYSLFNTDTYMQGLGLNLVGLTNHPSWAVKAEIVRAKRKKNILFQTPLVPMMKVDGIGAFDNYPSLASVRNGVGVSNQSYPDAQPMTSSSVYVPRNFFWGENRNINQRTTPSTTGAGTGFRKPGETQLEFGSFSQLFEIFPPSNMYGGTEFTPNGQERIRYVDYALYRGLINDSTPAGITAGEGTETSISGTFHSLRSTDYYFDPVSTGKTIDILAFNNGFVNVDTVSVSEYEFFDNFSIGSSIGGNSILKYNDLSTKGYTFGFEPTVSRNSVIKTQLPLVLYPTPTESIVFASGTFNSLVASGYIVGASGVQYPPSLVPYGSNIYINNNIGYANDLPIGVSPIINIELGLGDDRYGDPQDFHEFISTGAAHTFSDSEIADLLAGNSVPIDLEVWGGDCFVSPHTFKISDSTYSNVNQEKWAGSLPTTAQLIAKWPTLYRNLENTAFISMPVAVKNAGQFLQVVLESEYNGIVKDKDILIATDNGAGVSIFHTSDQASIRTPLTYAYNINISKQNDEKVYVPKPEFSFEQNDFAARVIYSDLKIYNSSEQGFDVFRVLNFVDLEESRGAVTKLAVETDNLYAIQTNGIVYLPVGQTQVQETTGGSLAIGIAGVVGRPIVINSQRGGQHLRGIVETGDIIYIPDVQKKAIYAISGPQFSDENIISNRDNDTQFVTMFASEIPEKNLIGVYDPVKNHYWVAKNTTTECKIFNNKLGVWVGNYEFNNPLFGGAYTNQKMYLIGQEAQGSEPFLAVHEIYAGSDTPTQLFGTVVVPRVKISINPDEEISKTFDNVMLAATDRLEEANFVVERESSQGNQVITTSDLDIDQISGNYRIKVLLDAATSRARGLRMLGTFKWGAKAATLSSIITKYRLMPKLPF
jgi:hypothetical protein